MVYNQFSKNNQSFRLKTAVQCLVEKKGDGSLCPMISIDPILQKNIQKKFVEDFNQTETTTSILHQDGKFEVQIQTTRSAGIVLCVILRSTSDFHVVSWSNLEPGEES